MAALQRFRATPQNNVLSLCYSPFEEVELSESEAKDGNSSMSDLGGSFVEDSLPARRVLSRSAPEGKHTRQRL